MCREENPLAVVMRYVNKTLLPVSGSRNYIFLYRKNIVQKVLHITPSAESKCESGRLLAHELQKMGFLFDKRKYFDKCVATPFLPIIRLYKVPICRFIVATQMRCTSFSVTVPTYKNTGNVKKHVFFKSCENPKLWSLPLTFSWRERLSFKLFTFQQSLCWKSILFIALSWS